MAEWIIEPAKAILAVAIWLGCMWLHGKTYEWRRKRR